MSIERTLISEFYQSGQAEGLAKGLEEGREKGREEGLKIGEKKGLQEGIEKGRQETQKALAMNLIKMNALPDDKISDATGLSLETIAALGAQISVT